MALKRARSHSNNVTVIARIQSDLMDLLIIALTFFVLSKREVKLSFISKTFVMSSKLRVCSNYLICWASVLFLKQTNISDVFKIVSSGVDKR